MCLILIMDVPKDILQYQCTMHEQHRGHLQSLCRLSSSIAMLSKMERRALRSKLWAGTRKGLRGTWKARAVPNWVVRPLRGHWADRRRRITDFCHEIEVLSTHPEGSRDIRAVAAQLMEEIREWGHEESNFFAVCTEVVFHR